MFQVPELGEESPVSAALGPEFGSESGFSSSSGREMVPAAAFGLSDPLAALARETGLSPVTVRVCWMRGLRTAEAIRAFLEPKLEELADPFRIRSMDLAVERLARARAEAEPVLVFGDYDVDGTTGAALLSVVFRDFGLRSEATQPDRFRDGYGLNVPAVEEAAQRGVRLIVTVDCGITGFDAALRARALGVDLIVVDHHQVDPVRGLPEAFAVVNPQREDCPSGLRMLCGCGLAFYLARALRFRGRELGWWPAGQEPNLKQHLDLVVMATAADLVPLVGDNHILVRHGMEVLRASKKPGVRALLEVAGVGAGTELSPGHLGFVIGPRINASGRMRSASLALELLTTLDPSRAHALAQELERLNRERAELQNRIWDQVRARVEAGLAEGRFRHGICVGDAEWHEGVVGIVASRVTETFRKPAAVIAFRAGEGTGKGSVRSFAGRDVLAALRGCSELLLGFGGHRHAAGLSLAQERLEAFAAAFDDVLGKLDDEPGARPLRIDGKLSIHDLDLKTLRELEGLGPFGPGNPEPVFAVQAAARDHRVLKGRHLKLTLDPGERATGVGRERIEAIWFHGAEREALLRDGELGQLAEWAGVPELNRFRGRVTPTLRIRDRRPLEA
jgi:single-stranded-DNA-specific exonuclease